MNDSIQPNQVDLQKLFTLNALNCLITFPYHKGLVCRLRQRNPTFLSYLLENYLSVLNFIKQVMRFVLAHPAEKRS